MTMSKRATMFVAMLMTCVAVSLSAEPQQSPQPAHVEPPAAVAASPTAPFDVEGATRAYLSKQSPEAKAKSDAYFEGGYWLQLWNFLYTLAVAWLLLGSGLSARMKRLAERITQRRWLQTGIYAIQYSIVAPLLVAPLTLYEGFFREHKYGLATQTLGAWLSEQATVLVVEALLMAIALVPLYGVFRKAPKRWWLWGAGVGVAFLALVMLIGPVYLDPLFNTYKPLGEGQVRQEILSLARANGIEANDVYEFDASRQTTRISANVSGLFNTMSIRLNDNLLERCTLAEIKSVMAHEMGHYVLHHGGKMIVFFGVVLVGGFLFVRSSFDGVRAKWGARWGVTGIDDVSGFPLLVALFAVYLFAITPLLNTYIRSAEAEADIFGLHAAGEPDGFAEAALKLGDYRKLDPGPIEEWIFFDHPSGRARIHMAMTWKAEHLQDSRVAAVSQGD
ncbi:MAG: M48 family metallopeptidase [Acidobacteria bacterium]|nr:M48 family metallopeptidase [Acidobacteriota bacterium]